MRKLFLAVLFCGLFPGLLKAQSADASLTGRITDPNKAVILQSKHTV